MDKKRSRPYHFKRLNDIGLPTNIHYYYQNSLQEELYEKTYKLLCEQILDENEPKNEHNVKVNYSMRERLYNSINAELFRESNMSNNLKWMSSPLLTVIVVTFTGFVLNKYSSVIPLIGDVLIVLGVLILGILIGKLFVAPDVNFRILYLQECLRMIKEISENTHVALEIESNR